jgi:FAD/FMN-containing dehydrogenase
MIDDLNSHTRRELLIQLAAFGLLSSQLPRAAPAAVSESPADMAALTSDLKAKGIGIILPGEPSFETARLVYDRRADKRPAVILQCASVAHVQEALTFAQKQRLPLAIRSGGHSFTGRSTIDRGVLIDLAGMIDVKLDSARKTVTVGPGVRTAHVLGVTTAQGLAPVTTTGEHIGVIGPALFSGEGYMSLEYGNMCDNVLSLDVVLADGRLLTVSANEHPDLFWAMRGAGDNFGVVTSMTMRVYNIPKTVSACYLEYDAAQYGKRVMQFFRDFKWASPAPAWLGQLQSDAATKAPRVGILFPLFGDEQQAERDLATIDRIAPTVVRSVQRMSWLDMHTQLDLPPNNRVYIKQRDLQGKSQGFGDDTIDMLLEETRKLCADPLAPKPIAGTPCAKILFHPRTGAMGRPAEPPDAFALRGGFDLEVAAIWSDPALDQHHEGWANGVVSRFTKAGKAFNANLIANSTIDERVTRGTFGHGYQRLVELKRKYDPHNVFRSTTAVIHT